MTFFDKLVPKEYKFLQYPYYLHNSKIYNDLSRKKFDEKIPSVDKKRKEFIEKILKERSASSNQVLDKRLKNENEQDTNYNNKKLENVVEINKEGNFPDKNYKITKDNITNKHDFSRANINKINIFPQKTDLTNESFEMGNEDELKILDSKSNVNFTIKNNLQNKPNNDKNKNSLEKIRANTVSDLLLKIFSSANISRTLKRKFGENFEIKLTDKDVDPNFISMIENEVNELIDFEKEKEHFIKQRREMNHLRKRSVIKDSNSRAISPNSERDNFYKARESFHHYTKKSSGFFDPKLQYGGETCVPSTTRPKSSEKISYPNNTNKNKYSSNKLSIDLGSKISTFRDKNEEGWNSVREC